MKFRVINGWKAMNGFFSFCLFSVGVYFDQIHMGVKMGWEVIISICNFDLVLYKNRRI